MASEKSNPVDAEVVDVGEEMMPEKIRSLVKTRPAVFDLASAQKEFDYRLAVAEKLRPACMKLLFPKDFVVMGGGDEAPCYLQDTGAQRLKGLLGPIVPEPPKAERMELPNGQFVWTYSGYMGSRTIGSGDFVIGGRSSEEKWFDRKDDNGNRLPVDDLDVMKAAFTNWEVRALSGLAGLRGLTVADLKSMGFPIDKASRVAFREGAQGGAGKGGTTKFSDKWGPEGARGKAFDDPAVTMEHLAWWEKSFAKDIGDEAKAQYKASNEKKLVALKQEIERRKTNAEANPEAK